MKTVFLPYKAGSKGLALLKDRTDTKALRLKGSKLRGPKRVINWGNSNGHESITDSDIVINDPQAVGVAANKLQAFRVMEVAGVTIPRFSTNPDFVADMHNEGHKNVVSREKLTGHSGEGIVFLEREHDYDLNRGRLFVEYIPKDEEYRVHVWSQEVIDVRRKALRRGIENRENIDWRLRNHENGFIFARETGDISAHVRSESMKAVAAMGLDFGAVDIAYNRRRDKAYVLEVNTAPGLVGSTVDAYARKVLEVKYS